MEGRATTDPRRALATTMLCVVIAMLCAWSTPAVAQDGTATSFVRIQGETRITKLDDLDFGSIIPGDTGGTVTIANDGNRTVTGSVIALGGNPQAAAFNITRRFLLDYPSYQGPQGSDTIELANLADPTETMTLRNFTTDFNRTGFFGLPAYFFTNSYDFRVAGTLDVGADQAAGVYRGSFTVTIDYN